MLQTEQFKIIFPANKNPQKWIPEFVVLPDFGIVTPQQIAIFCAQIGHESLDMTVLEENLNYSSIALLRVFSKYFNPSTATLYHRRPEAIANIVYANRMGNGNTQQGDGWKFRGRGQIQCTGRQTYAACSKYLYGDESILLNDPDLLAEDPGVSLKQALWFWQANNLAKNLDIISVSRRVNGGRNGEIDRVSRYERALKVLR